MSEFIGNAIKKVKGTPSKTKVVNEIIKQAKVSDLLIMSFERWYKSSGFYLLIDPLDNDPVLTDYIMKPASFKDILEGFQKKYSIYNHGYNIFIDGNIYYLLSKKRPNKLDYNNDWTYTFSIFQSDKVLTKGHNPIVIDHGLQEIELAIPDTAIRYSGHFVDKYLDKDITNIIVNNYTGSIDIPAHNSSILSNVTIDNHAKATASTSGNVANIAPANGSPASSSSGGGGLFGKLGGALGGKLNGFTQGLTNKLDNSLNKVNDAINKSQQQLISKMGTFGTNMSGHLMKSELSTKGIIDFGKSFISKLMQAGGAGGVDQNIYDIKVIYLENSFLGFIPGDNIVIRSIDEKETTRVWKGTVKRWASEQIGYYRGVYVVVVGKVDYTDTPFGNLALRSKMGVLGTILNRNSLISSIRQVTNLAKNVSTGVRTYSKEIVNISRGYPKKMLNSVINTIYTHGMKYGLSLLDEYNIDIEKVNELWNLGEAIYRSPNLRKLGGSIYKMIGHNGGTIGDIMKVNGISSESDGKIQDLISQDITIKSEEKDGTYKNDYEYLIANIDILSLSKNSDVIDEFIKNYLFWGNGYDAIVNSLLIHDIYHNTGIWRRYFDAVPLGLDIEYHVFKDILLVNLTNYSIRKFEDKLKNLNAFLEDIRKDYLKNLKTKELKDLIDYQPLEKMDSGNIIIPTEPNKTITEIEYVQWVESINNKIGLYYDKLEKEKLKKEKEENNKPPLP